MSAMETCTWSDDESMAEGRPRAPPIPPRVPAHAHMLAANGGAGPADPQAATSPTPIHAPSPLLPMLWQSLGLAQPTPDMTPPPASPSPPQPRLQMQLNSRAVHSADATNNSTPDDMRVDDDTNAASDANVDAATTAEAAEAPRTPGRAWDASTPTPTAPLAATPVSSTAPTGAGTAVSHDTPLFTHRTRTPSPSTRPPLPPRPSRPLGMSSATAGRAATPAQSSLSSSAALAAGLLRMNAAVVGFELVYADGRSSAHVAMLPPSSSSVGGHEAERPTPKFTLYKILVSLSPPSALPSPQVSAPGSPQARPMGEGPVMEPSEMLDLDSRSSDGQKRQTLPLAVSSHSRSQSARDAATHHSPPNGAAAASQTRGIDAAARASPKPPRHTHSQSSVPLASDGSLTTHSSAPASAPPSKGWFVYRRYSDFWQLHQRLLQLPQLGGAANLEENWLLLMPQRLRAPASFSADVIQMRYALFDSYVRNLCARPELSQLPDVQALLGVDEPAGEPIRGKHSGSSGRRGKQVLSSQLLAKMHASTNNGTTRDVFSLYREGATPSPANVPATALMPLYSIPFSSVLSYLSTGDILLFRTSSTLSAFQRWGTHSSWDHVAMVLQRPILSKNQSNLCLLESVHAGGIKCNPIEGAIQEWRRRGLTKIEKMRRKLAAETAASTVNAALFGTDIDTPCDMFSSLVLDEGGVLSPVASPSSSMIFASSPSSSSLSAMLSDPAPFFPVISIRKLCNWAPSNATLLKLEEFVESIVGNSYSLRGILKLGRKLIKEMVGAGGGAATQEQAVQTSYFCSELIAACYRVAGLLPTPATAGPLQGGADSPTHAPLSNAASSALDSNPLLRKSISDYLPGDFSTEDPNARCALDQLLWTTAGVTLGEEVRIDLHVEGTEGGSYGVAASEPVQQHPSLQQKPLRRLSSSSSDHSTTTGVRRPSAESESTLPRSAAASPRLDTVSPARPAVDVSLDLLVSSDSSGGGGGTAEGLTHSSSTVTAVGSRSASSKSSPMHQRSPSPRHASALNATSASVGGESIDSSADAPSSEQGTPIASSSSSSIDPSHPRPASDADVLRVPSTPTAAAAGVGAAPASAEDVPLPLPRQRTRSWTKAHKLLGEAMLSPAHAKTAATGGMSIASAAATSTTSVSASPSSASSASTPASSSPAPFAAAAPMYGQADVAEPAVRANASATAAAAAARSKGNVNKIRALMGE